MSKLWDPNWKALPPVEAYTGEAAPPRRFTHRELVERREQYHRTHAEHVLAKEEEVLRDRS